MLACLFRIAAQQLAQAVSPYRPGLWSTVKVAQMPAPPAPSHLPLQAALEPVNNAQKDKFRLPDLRNANLVV